MTRLEERAYAYKDGVRFSNGAEVLLQRLNVGLSAVVMTYGAERAEPIAAKPAVVREPELV